MSNPACNSKKQKDSKFSERMPLWELSLRWMDRRTTDGCIDDWLVCRCCRELWFMPRALGTRVRDPAWLGALGMCIPTYPALQSWGACRMHGLIAKGRGGRGALGSCAGEHL